MSYRVERMLRNGYWITVRGVGDQKDFDRLEPALELYEKEIASAPMRCYRIVKEEIVRERKI